MALTVTDFADFNGVDGSLETIGIDGQFTTIQVVQYPPGETDGITIADDGKSFSFTVKEGVNVLQVALVQEWGGTDGVIHFYPGIYNGPSTAGTVLFSANVWSQSAKLSEVTITA